MILIVLGSFESSPLCSSSFVWNPGMKTLWSKQEDRLLDVTGFFFFSLPCSNTNFDYCHASPQKAKMYGEDVGGGKVGGGLRGTVFTLLKEENEIIALQRRPGTHFNSTPLQPFPLNLGPRSLSLSALLLCLGLKIEGVSQLIHITLNCIIQSHDLRIKDYP